MESLDSSGYSVGIRFRPHCSPLVDGKVVYEIRYGDEVAINRAEGGRAKVRYTRERFPAYTDGCFGFRLTTSYHIYSNFRVYRLKPTDEP